MAGYIDRFPIRRRTSLGYNQLREPGEALGRIFRGLLRAASCILLFHGPAPAVELAPVSELARGMRGYGLTVVEGTRIDTFGVEILGVEHNSMLPGRDVILVRLSGLGLEETGLVAGMSGSPVYVEGRLVGAVAWGWFAADEPVGLLTPIHEMLAVMERDLSPPARGSTAAPAPARPSGLVRLAAPVWVSGVGRGTAQRMAELLSPLGLEPLLSPGGDDPALETPPLQPGSAVGVQLMGGDLSMVGIGTVTHVDGDRLVAFGHDFIGSGAIDLPMTGAHIFGVLDHRFRSFKLGAATGTVGAVRQDRFGGIAGLTGARAGVLPVEVAVAPEGETREFRFEVARHRFFTAGLIQSALIGALESTSKVMGETSIDLEIDIELDDGREVSWDQIYSGVDATFGAAFDAGTPLRALVRTSFEGIRLAGVRVRAEVREEEVRVARLAGASLDRPRVRAGEEVTVSVRLAPYRSADRVLQIPVRVPADAAGEVGVRVGSGRLANGWETERLDAGPPADPGELLRRLNRPRREDELVVQLTVAEPGLSVDGRELPSPPPSVHRLLSQSPVAGSTRMVAWRVLTEKRVPAGFVLRGEQSLVLEVDPEGRR